MVFQGAPVGLQHLKGHEALEVPDTVVCVCVCVYVRWFGRTRRSMGKGIGREKEVETIG